MNRECPKRENIEALIEWAAEQEKSGQDVIDNCIDYGCGDCMDDVQQEKETYRQIGQALRELLKIPRLPKKNP